MKLRIEYVPRDADEEIVVRVRAIDAAVQRKCEAIQALIDDKPAVVYYKAGQEFYLPAGDVLFFETDGETVYAHTCDDMYKVHHRLYELEGILPTEFMRISKSTVANTAQILSVSKNLASSSPVQFAHSHKQVYVSRFYFGLFKYDFFYLGDFIRHKSVGLDYNACVLPADDRHTFRKAFRFHQNFYVRFSFYVARYALNVPERSVLYIRHRLRTVQYMIEKFY